MKTVTTYRENFNIAKALETAIKFNKDFSTREEVSETSITKEMEVIFISKYKKFDIDTDKIEWLDLKK